MRHVTTSNGLNTYISGSDAHLLRKRMKNGKIAKKDLNSREGEFARRMVTSGVLKDCPTDRGSLVMAEGRRGRR